MALAALGLGIGGRRARTRGGGRRRLPGSGSTLTGFVNYLLVWGTVHQLGFAWLDGALAGWRRRLLLCLAGLLGAVALVAPGPYPVSMVGVDTSTVTNTYPPRVTLLLLGMFQSGLVLLLEGPAARVCATCARGSSSWR